MVKKTNVKKLQQGGFGDITQLLNSIQLGVTNNSGIYKDPAPYEQLSFKDYQTKFNYTYKRGNFYDEAGNKISKGDFGAMYNRYIEDEQNKYNTNLTQYKEQQPFAANLAGLMQVQQMEQDELLNKKAKLSDFPTQYSSYAPVGFAKDGGGMYVDGMNKRDKSLISNNFMQQLMGYKDNSPFKNLPFQDIMSNNITMDGVSKPLLLMPNNDTARLAPPNSGNYFFPNSTSVRELPLAKNGKKIKVKSYRDGGGIQLPVGNFDNKHKQYTTFENLIPVQTEVNELIVLPNLSLAKVNAKKRHSQMKTDEVTDVAPNGSYVLSHYGDTKIYKEEASRVDMELHDKPYNTAKSNSIPVIKTLGDLMKSKRMSPADLARVVDKKFTTAEDNGDPYIMQTNSVNKSRKDNYITKIVQLSEMDKERKGLNEVEKFYHGGAPVQKAPAGTLLMALLPSLIAAAPQVAGMISNNNSQKDVKRNTAQSIRDINNTYEGVLGLENNALAANLLGISLQNPNIKPVIQDDSFIAGIPNLLNATYNNVYEGQRSSLMANRPDFSAFSPQVATLLSDRSNAQSMGALSNLSLGLAKERAAATSKSAYDRMGIFNANSASRTGAENATQANVNANLAAAAGAVSGSYSNRQNMLYNKTNSIMGARGQQAQQLMQLQNQQAQNLVGLGATGLQAYNSFQAANRQQQVEDRMAYQDQFGYNTPPLGQTPLGPINSGSPCVLVLGKMINRITGQPC